MKQTSTKRQRRIFPASTPIVIGEGLRHGPAVMATAAAKSAALDALIVALERAKAARDGRPARRLNLLACDLALLELEAESEGPIRRIE